MQYEHIKCPIVDHVNVIELPHKTNSLIHHDKRQLNLLLPKRSGQHHVRSSYIYHAYLPIIGQPAS